MSKFEMYHLVLIVGGQFVVLLGVIWGVLSYKFKAFDARLTSMEKTFDTKVSSIKELYESDVRSLRVQISDMKCEIKTRVEVFREEAKSYVTVRVCEARTKYEDKTLGMLETRLAEISEKLDKLMLQKSTTSGG